MSWYRPTQIYHITPGAELGWRSGENDMFNETYMANYGRNPAIFLVKWRRDLKTLTN